MENKLYNLQIDERSVPTDLEIEYAGLANLAKIVIGGAIAKRDSDIEEFGKPIMSDKKYVENIFNEVKRQAKEEDRKTGSSSYNPRAKEFVMGVFDPIGEISEKARKSSKRDSVSFQIADPLYVEVKE